MLRPLNTHSRRIHGRAGSADFHGLLVPDHADFHWDSGLGNFADGGFRVESLAVNLGLAAKSHTRTLLICHPALQGEGRALNSPLTGS